MIDWSGNSNDEEVHVLQFVYVGCKVNITSLESRAFQFLRWINIVAHHVDALLIDIETNHFDRPRKLKRNRQPHVAKADDGELGLFVF